MMRSNGSANGQPKEKLATSREQTSKLVTPKIGVGLQGSEEFSSNLLTHSPVAIWVANPDYSIRYVNPALEKLTGFFSSELVGTEPPFPFWAEESVQQTEKWWHTRHKELTKAEFLFKRKNGERFWVEITSVSVISKGVLKYYISTWVDITEAKQLRENSQFYVSQITRVQEEERKWIARELHDETAQVLSSLCVEIGEIIKMEGQPKLAFQRLKQVPAKIEGIVEEVRRFSHELRPGLLDHFGLIPSLELLSRDVNTEGKLNCCVEVIGSEQRLSPETETMLFRITQEALRNVRKHSNATGAVVTVEFSKGKVRLSIRDNGNGFRIPRMLSGFARRGKLGLMGMQERAHLLNGNLKVESKISGGTTIEVEIPTQPSHNSV